MGFVEKLLENPIEPRLSFTKEEYQERAEKVRKLMGDEGIDVLLISNTSSIGYLTGYDTSMPPAYSVLIFPIDKDPILHCADLEAPCMVLNGWVKNIKVFDWHEAQDTGTDLANVLVEQGYDGKRIGLEMGNVETFASGAFDTKSYLKLKEKLPNASFVDTTHIVMNVRLIKSPQELAYMRQAGQLTWTALDGALETIGEGVGDNEVIAAAHQAVLHGGSELMSIDPMIMSGERTGYMPHIAYKRDKIKAGDPVYLEMTGTYNRYNAPSMRSAVVGEPSDDVRRISEASINTVKSLLENIKPGRTGHDVAQVAKKELSSVSGLFFHGAYGYSIGMGNQPTWTESAMYIAEGEHRELKPGMAFHLAICVVLPGNTGVGFSESITVTENGCECLTPNKNLFLKEIAPSKVRS